MKLDSSSTNLPLVLELPIFENGTFLSDQAIKEKIEHYISLYPPNRKVAIQILILTD
jgi:hypothetical protein